MIDRGSWAEVDLGALRRNFEATRALAGRRSVIAVVKADAYGHGAARVAAALVEAGCRRLAVVSAAEGLALREAGVGVPIGVMGGIETDEAADLVLRHDLSPTLHHAGQLRRLASALGRHPDPARSVAVEVEVDTGMSRMGVPAEDAVALLGEVARAPGMTLAGTYTHFASADAATPDSALAQLGRFREVLEAARGAGVDPGCVHAANSAGLLAGRVLDEALPEAGAVRPGLMLYGVRPAEHLAPEVALEPVMHVRAKVVALRDIPAGTAVGYGETWRAKSPTRVATLAIGYEDGVHRALANRGAFHIAGLRRPILGRVSMDYVTVDVTAQPGADAAGSEVALGDVATFFGAPDLPGSRVEGVAREAGTSGYEMLTSVGARLPRRLRGDV